MTKQRKLQILLCLIAFFFLMVIVAFTEAHAANPVYVKAHKTTHSLINENELSGGNRCSGTAIGPNALLTAAHCQSVSTTVTIDAEEYKIHALMGDGLDHVILLVDGPSFTDFADVGTTESLTQGDEIFLFGNPGELQDQFRLGYFTGFEDQTDTGDARKYLFDLNGFFGDSGSGIFNDKGELVGVTSFVKHAEQNDVHNKYMGALPLRFTKDQLDQAKKYKADVKKPRLGDLEHWDRDFSIF